LKAAHNEIAHLPNSLAQLINLQELDLSFNCLSTVPDFIANLPSLQHLDISSNPLKNLPTLKDSNITNHSQNSSGEKLKFFDGTVN
jgi:Leucine-rich repeat (LRR) protein